MVIGAHQKRSVASHGSESQFWAEARVLQTTEPRVRESTMMRRRCLRFGHHFIAMHDAHSGGMVVRLPDARVAALIASGVGEPFAPSGRAFHGWMVAPSECHWRNLLEESLAAVKAELVGAG